MPEFLTPDEFAALHRSQKALEEGAQEIFGRIYHNLKKGNLVTLIDHRMTYALFGPQNHLQTEVLNLVSERVVKWGWNITIGKTDEGIKITLWAGTAPYCMDCKGPHDPRTKHPPRPE